MMILPRGSLLDEAEHFVSEEIRPRTLEIENVDHFPKSLIGKLADKRLLTANIPEKYGGAGLNAVEYGKFTEIIGKVCSATRTLITVHASLVSETIRKWGNTHQKEEWLPKLSKGTAIGAFALSEPGTGSDAKNIATTYRRAGNKYILNGVKKWISFGEISDLYLTFAKEENNGQITAFIVERAYPGVKTTPIKGMMVGKGTHLATIAFEDVQVPEDNIIGKVGSGFSYIANYALDHGRYSVAWAGVAIAQAALEEMVRYSKQRKQFGTAICNSELIQRLVADSATKVSAARMLCIRAGELRDAKDAEAVIATATAKYFAAETANQVAANAVQVLGANGLHQDFRTERLFREAKALEIIEGSSQILQLTIAKHVLSQYP
ncbi:acyl-CoA dehydrogenase family protein [Paenibacillus pabuli]|uniref:acyl-CoA dehydrogenase family protein n=1 Tax=Paenibacillus pabuli TaxID=1472 RepID=UPI003CF3B78A